MMRQRYRLLWACLVPFSGYGYDLGGPCEKVDATVGYSPDVEVSRRIVRNHCEIARGWVFLAMAHYLQGETAETLAVFEEMRRRQLNFFDEDLAAADAAARLLWVRQYALNSVPSQTLPAWMAGSEVAGTEYGQWRARIKQDTADRHRRLLTAALAQARQPPARYVVEKACPFECRQFGRWTANRPNTLYRSPTRPVVVARIRTGETVTALTGRTTTRPIPYVEVYDDALTHAPVPPERQQVKWILAYLGEGQARVWDDGQIADATPDPREQCLFPARDCPMEYVSERTYDSGEQAWWVRIRTRGGQTGWTRHSDFAGKDGCG